MQQFPLAFVFTLTMTLKSLLPRRRSVAVVATLPKEKPLPSLTTCILLDVIGYASFAVPLVGELFDLAWAPISALLYWRLFGFRKGFIGGWFSFVEELLPGLDVIPTFTITWALLYFKRNKVSFKPLIR